MENQNKYYIQAVFFAILINIIVIAVLVINFSFKNDYNFVSPTNIAKPTKIINTVTIDSAKVQQEIARIKARDADKIKQEQAYKKRVQLLQKQLQSMQHETAKMQSKRKQTQQELDLLNAKRQQIHAEQELQNKIAQEHMLNIQKHNVFVQKEVAKYKALILNSLGQHWIMPDNFDKSSVTKLLINLAPDGTVLNVRVLQSSNSQVLDRSVIQAVWKASPLPVPKETDVFAKFKQLRLTVKPQGFIGSGR
jgi:colicin import membrane protein